MQGIGAAVGPFIAGWLLDLIGPRGLPLALSAFQLAIFGWGIFRVVVRSDPETIERRSAPPLTAHPVEGDLSRDG